MSVDIEDVHFLCTALFRPYPDESQYVVGQIMDQIERSSFRPRREYVKGEYGYERVTVLEKDGLEVRKRIFHPGRGETATGADLLVSKRVKLNVNGAVLIQVKRNRGKPSFHFDERNLNQLKRILKSWSSSYYLFVDETLSPPFQFFVRSIELNHLISDRRKGKSVNIPNEELRRHSRGTDLFYKLFYNCQIGQRMPLHELTDMAYSWSMEYNRIIIELFLMRKGVPEKFSQARLI